ncbi:signal peptidase II [Geomesophilobacter sediminis]|uniref:Lipoprotein signal peptidase n=1 Tax=Geomesophilobacter sediminis TaxID=2798584 RepID=A0A8J7LZ59_9BACT|nr:signal peptidase II [Geomesophilobacter sediminis]MBJ6726187.1 signal peptidase II [Geomesophilobacter sediminis]
MRLASKFFAVAVTLICCVGCDQVTKSIARKSLGSEPLSYLGNLFRLQYVENPGAFLSLGAGAQEQTRFLVFTVFTGVFLAALVGYVLVSRRATRAEVIAVSLLAGGGVGNLIDRVMNHGRVVDFLNLGIGPVRTGVFNVADVAITVGALWMMGIYLKKEKSADLAGRSK